jgi:hypothetical protein
MSLQHTNGEEKLLLEQKLRQLLPKGVTPLVEPEDRAIAVLGEQLTHNTLRIFTSTEWDVLLVLAGAYPHYASYARLLQQLSSYSYEQARQLLQESTASERSARLKPIHRALSNLRGKLHTLHADLSISHVMASGYVLTSPAPPVLDQP